MPIALGPLARCSMLGKGGLIIGTNQVSGACVLLRGNAQATSKQPNMTRKYIGERIKFYEQNTRGDVTEEFCRCWFLWGLGRASVLR